jgi:hypothetical protein
VKPKNHSKRALGDEVEADLAQFVVEADSVGANPDVADLQAVIAAFLEKNPQHKEKFKHGRPSDSWIRDKWQSRSDVIGKSKEKELGDLRSDWSTDFNFRTFYDQNIPLLIERGISEVNPHYAEDEDLSQPIRHLREKRMIFADESKLPIGKERKKGGKSRTVFTLKEKSKKVHKSQRGEQKSQYTVASTSATFLPAMLGNGDNMSFRIIHTAENVKPEWCPEGSVPVPGSDGKRYQFSPVMDKYDRPMTCNGRNVHITFSANSKGGMTPSEFMLWLQEDIIPFCDGASADDLQSQYLMFIDGCDDHSLALAGMEMAAAAGICIPGAPPNTTGDWQAHDHEHGPLHTLKQTSWRGAQCARKLALARFDMHRALDRTDLGEMLLHALPQACSRTVNVTAMEGVGLVPYTREPLFRDHIAQTKGKPLAEACKQHLDGERIKFLVQAEGLEAAGEELLKMLGGNKYSSGKLWNYAGTSEVGLAIRRAYSAITEKKKRDAQEKKENTEREATEKKAAKAAVVDAAKLEWRAKNGVKQHCDCFLGGHQGVVCVGGHLCRSCSAVMAKGACRKGACVAANKEAEAEELAAAQAAATAARPRR